MTWLYVPGTASSFALASEDSDLASASPNPDTAASVTWRGKLLQPPALSRAWKRASWMRLLSGLTLPRSTLDRGAAAFISSLPAIPANPTASRAKGLAPMTSGSLPNTSCASSMKAGLIVSSVRTSQGMRTDSLQHSSRHWRQWVVALRSESSEREKSGPHISASVSSSWPTVRTSDTNEPGLHGDGGLDLRTAAATWPTPRASDGEKGSPHQSFGAGGVPLAAQAANWATPCARDHKGSGPATTRADGKSRMDMLDYQAEQGFSALRSLATADYSLPDHPTPSGLKSAETRRRLNPRFVEWLMGWPIGWTSFEHAETGLSAWLLLMRGELSTLCSRTPRQGTLL